MLSGNASSGEVAHSKFVISCVIYLALERDLAPSLCADFLNAMSNSKLSLVKACLAFSMLNLHLIGA